MSLGPTSDEIVVPAHPEVLAQRASKGGPPHAAATSDEPLADPGRDRRLGSPRGARAASLDGRADAGYSRPQIAHKHIHSLRTYRLEARRES
jgi:hypothetical protein